MTGIANWFDSVRTSTPEGIIFVRLLLAALLGGLVGLDREIKRRPAGLRTHMLIATAAALLTIITIEVLHDTRLTDLSTRGDPIRIIEAVTAGVAFLAAGAIIQARETVIGVTTGASMWMVGALGVAAGMGDYTIAVMATVLTLIILALISRFEQHINSSKEGSESNDSAKR